MGGPDSIPCHRSLSHHQRPRCSALRHLGCESARENWIFLLVTDHLFRPRETKLDLLVASGWVNITQSVMEPVVQTGTLDYIADDIAGINIVSDAVDVSIVKNPFGGVYVVRHLDYGGEVEDLPS